MIIIENIITTIAIFSLKNAQNVVFHIRNKFASFEATLVWNYDLLTHKGKV